MSDGALSQDEIDALLAGVDSTGFGGGGAAPSSSVPDGDRSAVQGFLASTVQSQGSNLSMLTGSTVQVQSPDVQSFNRESLLQKLPDMVVSVKCDFNAGYPGEHLFVMSADSAKRIASLMNKEDNIELDEMALSVIGEVASQLSGTMITALSDKTGNKGIAAEPPQPALVPKAVVALPSSDFLCATYRLDLGDGTQTPLWEVFGPSPSREMAKALGGGSSMGDDFGSLGAQQAQSFPPMGGGMGQGMGNMGGMQMPQMGGMGNMGGMQMPQMGGMNAMGNMGGYGMGGQTSVQSIQFPNLIPHGAQGAEGGNIGLIMDVFMEMTVELGRTKKLIKEILGMGEGTIIELDKLAGEPVDILVNHKLIAKGEVVVIDENFGVRVTEIVSPLERMSEMG